MVANMKIVPIEGEYEHEYDGNPQGKKLSSISSARMRRPASITMVHRLIILLAMLKHRNNQERAQVSFRDELTDEANRRRNRSVTRNALLSPKMAPFLFLFNSLCDQSLITMTGIDYATFQYVLHNFKPLYDYYSPYLKDGAIRVIPQRRKPRERPISLDAVQCLGLVLTWYRTRGGTWVLCMMLGITSAVCSLFTRFGRRILLRVLSRDSAAAIKMPTAQEVSEFKSVFKRNYHCLDNVYSVADGLKLYLQQSGDCIIRNMFYNGWTHDHYVGNVLVFAPNGVIIACAINSPGSMHDSQIAEWGGIYEKLEECYLSYGGKVMVDSAFAKGAYPFLIKSAQDETNANSPMDLIQIRQAMSARQASEWGMRAFQGTFPRMKDRFYYEENGERKLVLLCGLHLFNLRSKMVDINQILSFHMPHLGRDTNEFMCETLNLG